ncbi:MAG: response regulator [Hylemonella sp.]|nr:response regulator [Hylemonella sp.]
MKKILIIDDHAQSRQLVKWALAESGYELYEASNGSAGLNVARHVRPDLVLLDVVMPGEHDGYRVCAELRSDEQLANVRIVLLSSNDRPEDRETGQRAGANAYLVKPFKPAGLRSVVAKLLEA